MKPDEAFEAYNAAESIACVAYRQYWITRFSTAGVSLTAGSWYGQLDGQFNQYIIAATVRPALFAGVKVEIQVQRPHPHTGTYNVWHAVKVKSETGFLKLIRNLHTGFFK
jgi:hypothetical protein